MNLSDVGATFAPSSNDLLRNWGLDSLKTGIRLIQLMISRILSKLIRGSSPLDRHEEEIISIRSNGGLTFDNELHRAFSNQTTDNASSLVTVPSAKRHLKETKIIIKIGRPSILFVQDKIPPDFDLQGTSIFCSLKL